jgi:hypothetical protein
VRTGPVLALLAALLLAGCGGDSEDNGGAAPAGGLEAADEAYGEAYAAAWIRSCRKAVAAIRKEAPGRASSVNCGQPVEQMEGNTSFDPEQASIEGRRQGTFDGCAYAWDDAYADSGEVEPRC